MSDRTSSQVKSAGISMGAIGSVLEESRSSRWKGLIPTMSGSIAGVQEVLWECITTAAIGGSRLTVRVFADSSVEREQLGQLTLGWRDTQVRCEAMIPLPNNASLAYYGGNTPARMHGQDMAEREWNLLKQVQQRLLVQKFHELPPRFFVEILTPAAATSKDIAELVALYERSYVNYLTVFTEATVAAMLADNIVAIVRNDSGTIVAVSQGEVANLPGLDLTLVELTETACDPAYRGKWLTGFCKQAVVRHLHTPQTVFFADSRANCASVLSGNLSLGMEVVGRLPRHCLIDSDERNIPQVGEFGNLFVNYMPPAAVAKICA